jgi:hypothetical protein
MKIEKVVVPGILLITLSISCLIFLNSRWGIGVTHDSIFYLTSAGNLVNHSGLQWSASDGSLHPLTHFPPFYPLVIAFMMAFGIPGTQAATWLAAILLGLNVFTAGYLVYRFSHSKLLSLLAAFTLAISTGFISLHLIALSEPLFVWLALCSIGTLGVYFERPSMKLLLTAAFVAALSILTRYIGIAVIATGFLAIAVIGKIPFRTRVANLVIYLATSLLPFLLWAVHNFLVAGSTTNRTLVYHPLDWGNRKLGLETISDWFIWAPVSFKATIAISGLFLGVVFFWWLWLGWKIFFSRTMKPDEVNVFRFVFILNLFSLVYLTGILFSLTFFDASTRLDGRILAPVYVAFLCALFANLGCLSIRWQWMGGIISAFLIILNLPTTISSISDFIQNGKGFTSQSWQTSKVVEFVRDAPAEDVIYSNQGMALYFLAERPLYEVPEKMDVVRNVVRDDYPAQLKSMVNDLKTPGSFVVWFAGGGLSDSILNDTGIDLQVYREYPDATILATAGNVKNGSLP